MVARLARSSARAEWMKRVAGWLAAHPARRKQEETTCWFARQRATELLSEGGRFAAPRGEAKRDVGVVRAGAPAPAEQGSMR